MENLRSLKVTHGFKATADVDMALWVLQLGVVEGRLKDHLDETEYLNLRDGFERDRVLRDIRMSNLARQLFQGIPRLDLARALANAGYLEIAGQIAGCELERRVANRLSIAADSDMKLRDMIDEAWSGRGPKHKYQRAVDVRNQAVHRQEVTREEMESLIKAVESVKAHV